MTLLAGVDDAGRGPVIGPLVVAGVLLPHSNIYILKELGVRDSKLLTQLRRTDLSKKIKKLSLDHTIIEIEPSVIDDVVFRGEKLRRLNWLEAKAMAKVIERLMPEVVYVDASDVNEKRFGNYIKEFLSLDITIISEHHADFKYTIVSAASIIAKDHRDKVVSELRRKYGDFGSGYPSDPKTRQFLADWLREKKDLPSFVRKSWKTIKRLRDDKYSGDQYK